MIPSSALPKCLHYIIIALLLCSCAAKNGKPRVLVFSKTAGFHHESIADGNTAILQLGATNNFDVDTTTDAAIFTDDSLKKYAAVVFLSTTGDVLNYRQEAAFERYIQAGGGYMGIHAATDCEPDWGWYGRLAGAYFQDHPGITDSFPNVQPGVLLVTDSTQMATRHLPQQWKKTDEFYNFRKMSKDVKVILTVDEKSYQGGKNGNPHPIAWYHEFDGGRAFYTELGHTPESFSDTLYLQHILGGIQYAIGKNKKPDYSNATTQMPPDDDRFSKEQLSQGTFFEPTEMTILPNLDILVIQRRGEIMLYKNDTKKVSQVGFLNVYYKTDVPGVNAEEGMLGLQKDPDFAKNNWVYIYYSPADSAVNRLSRFTFKNDTLDAATEKVILEVKSQRDICCHTGGSIAFGPDGLLYVSSGDNATPFDEPGVRFVNNGYSPMNDIPGHQQYDAGRSSGNTNDLRGKILRIRVKPDGSYEIPDGNLFPKGTDKTRPEIYVMGNRNPYRISVDQKTGYLYWGEVGPDAGSDNLKERGPRGYDEVNQARKAGFFGWPLFVGNNYAYRKYDYSTGQSGDNFDPAHPVNASRNNTGLTQLPPAQPAFIWYPYAASPDFPQVGSGGRNAMAGPVYYTDLFPKETRLPDYYNGKLIIYDWIRGWMKAVTMLPNGDFDKMEPFASAVKVNSLIDMEVGPDGRLYLLEYGSGWFSKNPDAGLARINFNGGNRAPAIQSVTVDKTTGVLPFTVKATVDAKDPDNDKTTYTWILGDGSRKETNVPELSYTYSKTGDFKITVEVKDDKGAVTKSDAVSIYAGNETPVVNIAVTGGNRSFYIPGVPLHYNITVTDPKDTAAFDAASLFVSSDFVEGLDKAGAPMGHQQGQASVSGKNMMLSLDCKACHKEAEKSVGPSFVQVAEKYSKDPGAVNYLTGKIINGGSGVWGETAMSAHPTLTEDDVHQIVAWILSLGNSGAVKKSLPASGTIVPPADVKPNRILVLSASYSDKGGSNIKSLTGTHTLSLKSNTISIGEAERTKEGGLALKQIDLTGVHSLNVVYDQQEVPGKTSVIEVRLDAANGTLLGSKPVPATAKEPKEAVALIPVKAITDGQFHTLYFIYRTEDKVHSNIKRVQFNGK
ncbi:ThuA domain-containing protein [Niabella drilacis]|uniref:Glucose/arabinose dehydrogenase, beta-propeller fold n=1 Tax=Niabella drilacis (strain DSM 25811 / CCM 8410 / CCUG 62505 / LMG 26954 / E90) TaxID=1285928 RepID=A0A1G6RM21_NIADE|nr:ThuA domain-containing protein [Niabella drilacis]SDD05481.1 Glucose/arabinose dehydrogenase, beta-propeller fold [Niabella drilacis]